MVKSIFYLTIIACIGFGFTIAEPKSVNEKVKAQDFMNVIYVINSNDGLSFELKSLLRSKIDSMALDKNAKFLLYISNGRDYLSSDKASSCKDALKLLNDPLPLYPNFNVEKDNLDKLLYTNPFKINKEINVSFFLMPKVVDDLNNRSDLSFLINMLPQEIAYISNLQAGNVNVNIFHNSEFEADKNMNIFYSSHAGPVKTQVKFIKVK
jgi:hypothetical protein